ncbi:unnamed protein product [Caenorhabditis auriculariae]|uniref:GPI ethanolamine phosphate transferase 2 C-terminal domain-containing protein n=1 Tax=Caenorhabditis auriculariae TaxID=2777116 RepID=A0A8S1HCQ8_9PELO|nr:unnamed protein product [Caenorhabditis auriculariae]
MKRTKDEHEEHVRQLFRHITLSSILLVLSVSVLVLSFSVLDTSLAINSSPTQSSFQECPTSSEKASGRRRIVFMVIDAWRLSFLTSETSPMKFVRSAIAKRDAVLFEAYARMPTVTLPRITAYLSGTLPSFGTVLTNFASSELKVDNWIEASREKDLKIHFFGDDTWLKLFPGKFRKSDGVTSFFVNDYTEVDNNVTRHLDGELSSDTWDILILHYLGLDHVGHSLGGTSPMINVKLAEMDAVVEKIVQSESIQSTETMVVVCGDHGMTEAGSHGGASSSESVVPVVFFVSRVGKREHQTALRPPRIEQMDVSATISSYLSVRQPLSSYGISLIPQLKRNWQFDEEFIDRDFQNTLRHFSLINGAQLLELQQQMKFSIEDCSEQNLSQSNRTRILESLHAVQSEEIEKASTTSINPMIICLALLALAFYIPFRVQRWHFQTSFLQFFLPISSYFSSSLIEEEHEIWYFIASTALLVNTLAIYLRSKDKGRLLDTVTVAVCHRLGVAWRQNERRRWSMSSDLLPPQIFDEPFLLKNMSSYDGKSFSSQFSSASLLAGLIWIFLISKKKRGFATALQVIGIFGSAIFHYVRNENPFGDQTLETAIRLFSLASAYLSPTSSILTYILFISPPHQLFLLAAVHEMGRRAAKAKLGVDPLMALLVSAFYYTGNSNSLSTIDLAASYTGVTSYQPIFIAFQLLLNMYAGPIVFILGLCSEKRNVGIELEALAAWTFAYRIVAFSVSILSFIIFRQHLFLWTVFAPKVVYDMIHSLLAAVLQETSLLLEKLTYKKACLIIATLEIVYWVYYAILLIFAVIHHQQAWSIVFTSVNLFMLTIQIAILWFGVIKEDPKFLQTHLIFLCLTILWDFLLFIGFFVVTVFPYVYSNQYLQYNGKEWNARTFAIVMGSLLLLWFVCRYFMMLTIFRFWKILRANQGYRRPRSFTQEK